VYEERGYHRIRWEPNETIYSEPYYVSFTEGAGSEYLAANQWLWGDFYDPITMERLFSESGEVTKTISFVKKDAVHQVTDARTNETRPVVVLFNGPDSGAPRALLKRHIAACFDNVSASEIVSLKVGEVVLEDDADVLALKEGDVIHFDTKKE
jgi:hypothetical protein